MTEQSQFPSNHVKCPKCGGWGACMSAIQQAIEKGKAPESTDMWAVSSPLEKVVHPIVNPATGLIAGSIPAMVEYYDTCIKCGTRWCVRQDIMGVPVQVRMPGNPR